MKTESLHFLESRKVENRTTLYQGKYKYKVDFTISWARFLCSHKDYPTLVRTIRSNWYTKLEIGDIMHLERIYAIRDAVPLTGNKKSASFVYAGGHQSVSFICNSLDGILEKLMSAGCKIKGVSEAVVFGNPETIYRKRPKHKYRVFFNDCPAGVSKYLEVKDLIERNSGLIFPSPTLHRKMALAEQIQRKQSNSSKDTYKLHRFHSRLYMDIDDEAIYMLVALTLGDTVRKCLPIELKTF